MGSTATIEPKKGLTFKWCFLKAGVPTEINYVVSKVDSKMVYYRREDGMNNRMKDGLKRFQKNFQSGSYKLTPCG